MFSAFRKSKSTHPDPAVDLGSSGHSGQLQQLKESTKALLADFGADPTRALMQHVIDCVHIMSTIAVPVSGGAGVSTKSIGSVASVCNSTFYDVMEILLAEVFCVQPAAPLSEAESGFCNTIGCQIARLYPSFLSRVLNERSQKTLLHIVSQQPVRGLDTVAAIHQLCPEQVRRPDASGALPLHYAAHSLHSSQHTIIRYLAAAYPDGARVADKEGYLPLHWAVNSKALRIDSVRALIEIFPEGCRHQCKGGTLPLHWAVDRADMSLDVVRLLHNHFPEAHTQTSSGDWLPLHRCVDREKVDLEVLQFLIQQNPNGLMRGNVDGHLPVHRLVDREVVDLRALEALVRACPESLSVPDLEGYLPLHTLLEAFSPSSGTDAFNMVLRAYPDAATLATVDGLCPLHCAMPIGEEWDINILQALVTAYPNGCTEEAVDTEPEDPSADPTTYEGRWRKFKWTPLSRATEQGNKVAADLLKKVVNKIALQKMTQQKGSSPAKNRPGKSKGPEGDDVDGSGVASLPVKLKSGQLAAIASKQPKQGPVVLPRPHMKSVPRMAAQPEPDKVDADIPEEEHIIVMPIKSGEFGLADIHNSQKLPIKPEPELEVPDALHVEDSDWVDDDNPVPQRGLPRNPDLLAREGPPLVNVHIKSFPSDDSVMLTVIDDDESVTNETQYTMRDRRHARTKDAKQNHRRKQISTPGGIPEEAEADAPRSPIGAKGRSGSPVGGPPVSIADAEVASKPLNLSEREAERRRELEKQKQERAARHAERKDKKRREKDHHKDRSHRDKHHKYNIAVANEILGSGINTNFNYDASDTPGGGPAVSGDELRLNMSNSSGNLRPQQLFDSPAEPPRNAPSANGITRGNSNLGTIIEKDVEDSPMKSTRPTGPSGKYHEGDPIEQSSFDEDDQAPPRSRPLNLAEREAERRMELEKQKQARDKQLVVKHVGSKLGKDRIVVKPSTQSWAPTDIVHDSSSHYNTSSAQQILDQAVSKSNSPTMENKIDNPDSPVALFERQVKRGPGGDSSNPTSTARPTSAQTGASRTGSDTNDTSFQRGRPASAKTSANLRSNTGHVSRRPPDDDEVSLSSRASRKVALEHMHNNFG